MSSSALRRRRAAACAAAALALSVAAGLAAAPGALAAGDTVQIRGNAYKFNSPFTRLVGATIGVAEMPGVTTTAGANGAYVLEVPANSTVTLWAEHPGYHRIYLQTLHVRRDDIAHLNFQIPNDATYGVLAAILGQQLDDNGDPIGCAIVSTFNIRAVRGPDFDEFLTILPHGIAGATATASPSLGSPIYFNESVVPDASRTSSSVDGGVVWPNVPEGVYTITASHPTKRMASFRATCVSGRVINANPPWGLYELDPGEETNPAALAPPEPTPDPAPAPAPVWTPPAEAETPSATVPAPAPEPVSAPSVEPPAADRSVQATLGRTAVRGARAKRRVMAHLHAGEPVSVQAALLRNGRTLGSATARLGAGEGVVRIRAAGARPGRALLRLTVTDEAGNTVALERTVRLLRRG